VDSPNLMKMGLVGHTGYSSTIQMSSSSHSAFVRSLIHMRDENTTGKNDSRRTDRARAHACVRFLAPRAPAVTRSQWRRGGAQQHAAVHFNAMSALQDRRQRWECPECGIVNRAWRDECFGEDCSVEYSSAIDAAKMTVQAQCNDDDNALVVFKDEKSKVIAKVPSTIAAALKSDLQYVVSRLAKCEEYALNKHENLKRTCVLQRQMRTGQQVVQDFEDSGALWGYACRKFSSRAVMSFELFSSARATLLASCCAEIVALSTLLESDPTVISIGGGPGNDMFGYLLFQRHVVGLTAAQQQDAAAAISEQVPPHLHVCDFAPGWSPIISRVAELSGRNIQFQTCDLKVPLPGESAANRTLQELLEVTSVCRDSLMVFVFCYVLSEVMGPSGDPPPLLEDILAYYESRGHGALFLFREPHTQALQTLLSRHEEWREGDDYWQLTGGGLMVWISPT